MQHRNKQGQKYKSLLLREDAIIRDPLPAHLSRDVRKCLSVTKPRVENGLIVEPISGPSRLFIFGAGHISRYISVIAKIAEFNVTVIDDRESFANRERFPEAEKLLLKNFNLSLGTFPFSPAITR